MLHCAKIILFSSAILTPNSPMMSLPYSPMMNSIVSITAIDKAKIKSYEPELKKQSS